MASSDPEAAVRVILLADGTVNAITVLIYHNRAPQSQSPPYIVISRIATEHFRNATGHSGAANTTIQVDCYSTSSSQVKALAEAAKNALSKGDYGTAPAASGLLITSLFCQNQQDDYEKPIDANDIGTHRVIQEYLVCHTDSIPS